MTSYKTIEGRAHAEIVEKKSRFIGQIAHVQTEDDALAFLEEVRSKHRAARHNVYAYIVRGGVDAHNGHADEHAGAGAHNGHADEHAGAGEHARDKQSCERTGEQTTSAPRIRYSDDGEPSKTAGVPTLETIQHAGLSDVAVVVTRYFGGILLGTGGLVRAYTQATQAAIEAAHVVTMQQCVDIVINVSYALYDQILHLAQKENAQVINTDFTDTVSITLRVPYAQKDTFIEKLVELSHGNSDILESDSFDAVW